MTLTQYLQIATARTQGNLLLANVYHDIALAGELTHQVDSGIVVT